MKTKKIPHLAVRTLPQGEAPSAKRCLDLKLDGLSRDIHVLGESGFLIPLNDFVELLPLLFGDMSVLRVVRRRRSRFRSPHPRQPPLLLLLCRGLILRCRSSLFPELVPRQ